LGDLGATYDDHVRLIGKRVVDFLLALIELFSLDVTAEVLRAITGSKSANLLQRKKQTAPTYLPTIRSGGPLPRKHSPDGATKAR